MRISLEGTFSSRFKDSNVVGNIKPWLRPVICRSEGFPRTGYVFLARGAPGVSPDGESSWDAAVAAAAVSRLEIQVDILAGELYLEFVPMELGLGGSSGRLEIGVLHRISIPSRWAEWFVLGSHFCRKSKQHI